MTYLYGDSTPSNLESNYIEFLRDAVEFCVQVLLADQRIVQARLQTRTLDHATAAEIDRLEKLGSAVIRAIEGVPTGAADSAAARCAAAIVNAAEELVRGEVGAVRAALAAEVERRDAGSVREREAAITALEALLVKHDLPDMTMDLHLTVVSGGRYACRTHLTSPFGLEATVDLEVPPGHLLSQVVRIDRLVERLEVQAPEMSGWLHKEVKLRPQHLERLHVTELSVNDAVSRLKLRTMPDGTGPGFDLMLTSEAPRVRLSRIDERDGSPEPPFEAQDADEQKLMGLYQRLAAAAEELTRHRRAVVDATLDGESLRTSEKASLLVERMVATMAPVVQEISARSHSPGELVLRRLIGEDRREEIFLSKDELKRKVEPLVEGKRALFDALWSEGAPPRKPAAVAASAAAAAAPAAVSAEHSSPTSMSAAGWVHVTPTAGTASALATFGKDPPPRARILRSTMKSPVVGTPVMANATDDAPTVKDLARTEAAAKESAPRAAAEGAGRMKPVTPKLGSRLTPGPFAGSPVSGELTRGELPRRTSAGASTRATPVQPMPSAETSAAPPPAAPAADGSTDAKTPSPEPSPAKEAPGG